MKKLLLYTLFIGSVLTSCKKEATRVFDESPDQRLEKVLTAFQNKLLSAQNGWKVMINPQTEGQFSFFMKFDNQNRVKMMADLNDSTASVVRESSYRLKAMQQPSLIFDTYNYLHMLMDPTPSVYGGTAGQGFDSDIEYWFPQDVIDALLGNQIDTLNTMVLIGRLNGAEAILTKATAAEEIAYNSGKLKMVMKDIFDYADDHPYIYFLTSDVTKVQVLLNDDKTIGFQWLKDGKVFTQSTGFAFTLDGLSLKTDTLDINGSRANAFIWDHASGVLKVNLNGTPVVIQSSASPILPAILTFGTTIKTIVVPNATNYAGWGTDFVNRRATTASGVSGWNVGGTPLSLGTISFINISQTSKTFTLRVNTPYGSNSLNLDYPYTYVINADNTFKFTIGATGGNAAALQATLAPLLAQRINTDRFTIDYFIDSSTGKALIQFKSVENPTFTFTGSF